jgi:uncharacterized repeat protein (TIGR03837 family)
LANLARFNCDIFCRVVDNFGDIGVAWRLARQLATEFGIPTRLFVDDLASFQRIAGGVTTSGLQVQPWPHDDAAMSAADLVIEAFACTLPAPYLDMMAARAIKPCWVNLEYLSAETWVAGSHLLPSPHPGLPLTKFFFFPGFDRTTGGLIRERALMAERNQFLAQPRRPIPSVFLFAYPNMAADALIDAIEATGMQTTLPEATSAAMLEKSKARAGVTITPFVPQTEFDALLWQHDFLLVRGEDSFVRAQWAGKPFVWHIYPQAAGAHWAKLDAFLDRYCAGLAADAAYALRALWRAWNTQDPVEIGPAWVAFVKHRETLAKHAETWAKQLANMPDLATNLVTFAQKTIKI